MKKLILFSAIVFSLSACSNTEKTEEQEKIERDSSDKVLLDANQRYVDSIEKADAEKEQMKTDSAAAK